MQQFVQFTGGVPLPHRCGSVVASDPAAIERESCVGERKMNGVSNHVVNYKCQATHTQRFPRKSLDIFGREVMNEEITVHEIERAVGKRKGAGVSGDGTSDSVQVGAGTIKKRDTEVKLRGKTLFDGCGYKSGAAGDLQQGSCLLRCLSKRFLNQGRSGAHAAEPAVEHLKIA